jgi:hypothetical protein
VTRQDRAIVKAVVDNILSAATSPITVDGDPTDWTGIVPIIQDPNDGLPGVVSGQFLPGLNVLEVSVHERRDRCLLFGQSCTRFNANAA